MHRAHEASLRDAWVQWPSHAQALSQLPVLEVSQAVRPSVSSLHLHICWAGGHTRPEQAAA